MLDPQPPISYEEQEALDRKAICRHKIVLAVAATFVVLTLTGVITLMVLNSGHVILDVSAAIKFIIAHNGASAYYPSCSKEAYMQTIAVDKFAVWHCSVNLLKDGTPVCLEDIMMEQVTDWDSSTEPTLVPETRVVSGINVDDEVWQSKRTGIFPDMITTTNFLTPLGENQQLSTQAISATPYGTQSLRVDVTLTRTTRSI